MATSGSRTAGQAAGAGCPLRGRDVSYGPVQGVRYARYGAVQGAFRLMAPITKHEGRLLSSFQSKGKENIPHMNGLLKNRIINIAKGTTDPRVKFISQVITQILIKQFQKGWLPIAKLKKIYKDRLDLGVTWLK